MSKSLKIPFLTTILIVSIFFVACNDPQPIDSPPMLTEAEIKGLKFMLAEEKLARDVYTHLGGIYAINIFDNIGASEQRHMDKVADLMSANEVEFTLIDEPGVFPYFDLQVLYDHLISIGEQSLLDALVVGATIEDKDIFDLNVELSETQNDDLIDVFETLKCASGNHMRAFHGQITNRGGEYDAQYLTIGQLQEVLNGVHEHCGH